MATDQYIKALAARDGVLRILSISHPEILKSDGFIFALDGHFILHDGGKYGEDALSRLLALREEVCPDGTLHFDWYISHYHVDHVGAPIENIIRDSRFAIDRVVMPPRNDLPEGMINSSDKYIPQIMEALGECHPNAEIVRVPYYSEVPETIHLGFGGADIEILPPDTDWGAPELLDKIARNYFCTDDIFYRKVQMYVTNITSIWLVIRYAGKKLIFTGDSTKRTRFMTDEGFDRMCALYADKIKKPNLFKWPHHGQAEDEAEVTVHDLIDPDYILTTTTCEGASVQYQKTFPDFRAEFVNSGNEDVLISVSNDSMTVEGGKRGVNDGEYFVLDIPGKRVAH